MEFTEAFPDARTDRAKSGARSAGLLINDAALIARFATTFSVLWILDRLELS